MTDDPRSRYARSRRRGGPEQPYTTGYINTEELHFVKRLTLRPPSGATQWEMECGRIGPVTELKDRTAAEVLAVEELCQGCITVAWTYHLGREAAADEPTTASQS